MQIISYLRWSCKPGRGGADGMASCKKNTTQSGGAVDLLFLSCFIVVAQFCDNSTVTFAQNRRFSSFLTNSLPLDLFRAK